MAISYSQQSIMHFKRFNIDHGLSQNTINALYEDLNGFIWIGTDDGVNRFDGINFKRYYFNLENNNSISNNQINSILEDQHHNIWVATENGLNQINQVTNSITRYYQHQIDGITNNFITNLKPYDNNSFLVASLNSISLYNSAKKEFSSLLTLDDTVITDFIVDKEGNLFIATTDKLFHYHIANHTFNEIVLFNEEVQYEKLLFDHNHNLWIGSNKGLRKIDPYFNNITPETILGKIYDNAIISLFEDHTKTIWIGTEDGLKSYNPNTNSILHYKNNSNDLNSLSNDSVYTIIQDQSETLWIGTFYGLNSLMLNQKDFNHISLFPEHTNNLSTNLIWCFAKDKGHNLWIGTANGLHVYNEKKNLFKSIDIENIDNSLKRNIFNIYFDTYGNLWAGGSYGAYFLPSNTIDNIWNQHKIQLEKVKTKSLKDITNITKIIENPDSKELWIGTLNNGIFKSHKVNKNPNLIEFTNYTYQKGASNSLPSNAATNLIYIKNKKQNHIWVGTRKGLSKYNASTQDFTTYHFRQHKEIDIQISALNTFKDSILWIGTFNSGLIKYNLYNQKYQYINTKNGLANNSIYGILNYQNEVWLSTNRGLSKYNIKTNDIKNYDKSFGLQGNEFGEGAYFKDRTNKLYFGGINGYNAFYSKDKQNNSLAPQINFIDLKIFNQSVKPNISNSDQKLSKDKSIILNKSIIYSDSIDLSYKHSVFSFKVAIIHNKNSLKNTYGYKLSSIDKDWNIRPSTQNEFTYTNLSPGNYILEVKAANSDGIWSKPKLMHINIKPPFWNTIWFYLVSALVVLIGIFLFLQLWKKQIKITERRDFHKKENDQKTAMIKEIHHRVKNNLQVINSFLRVQASKIDDPDIVTIFKKTQSRVLSMAVIHEKMYQTKNLHSLNAQEHFEPLIVDLIETYGINKNIELDLKISSVDFEMETLTPLALIINELISNSLKYAFNNQEKGIIKIHLNKTEIPNYFQLLIGDNGSGYDASKTTSPKQIGTKLIASFVKQLNGNIKLLKSTGTYFEIFFYSKKGVIN